MISFNTCVCLIVVSIAVQIHSLPQTQQKSTNGKNQPKRQPPTADELVQINGETENSSKVALSPGDPNSYSRPDQVTTQHIHMDWDIDFENKIVSGKCTYTFDKIELKAKVILMDVKGLNISSIKLKKSGESLTYTIDGELDYGSRLTINLPENHVDKIFKVDIEYRTTELCTALMWMRPEQTAGGSYPFMFSQSEAVHAKSLLPCQDTPSVKATYSANVAAPKGITVLMSALRKTEKTEMIGDKVKYSFEQPVPVMSYLIAVAAGHLESRKIGPRSHVWAEKKFVDQAADDFSETEKMIQIAEDINGPYVWGIYDILVLPPSFPYGGMENPCLTFVTPTLLSGDKANANVITHEIAHSWYGNLVTNKNFDHFWLNEGFTTYMTSKIKGRMQGEALRHFDAILKWPSYNETVHEVLGVNNSFTKLVVDLKGENPDDAFSSVPYVKGSTFLWYLEDLVESNYLQEFFLNYFVNATFTQEINWDAWLYDTGMPPVKPDWDSSLAAPCYNLSARWQQWDTNTECPFSKDDLADFLPEQVVEFLNSLLYGKALNEVAMDKLTQLYQLDVSKNIEILFRWIRIGLAARYEKVIPAAVDLVTNVGRMKYVRPIYRDLYAWSEKKQVALDTFEANKDLMMAVTRQGVEKDLKINQ